MIPSKFTESGFEWGPAKIRALFSDERKGWVTVGVSTAKGEVQIYVTKTGKIRVHSKDGEMTTRTKFKAKGKG